MGNVFLTALKGSRAFGTRLLLPVLGGMGLATGAASFPPPVTFNRDIAPLVFRHCAPCHQPGGDAPFPLLTYREVRAKAATILEVVENRSMPPWPPESGEVQFVGERRLSSGEIHTLRQWVESGLREGIPEDRPAAPTATTEWQLGEPDLIVTPKVPLTLAADGPDLYRNLVIPVPPGTNRYVRAIQIRPENRAVHHAFLLVDRKGHGRKLDDADPDPGFPGIDLPDGMESPGGHFLSWQPGRRAYESPPGLAWILPAGADFVMQLHLQPTGKKEIIRPRIGLYFTHRPPEREFFKMDLTSLKIDVPAGESTYLVRDTFVLPADVFLIGLNPHCHFLGRDLKGLAVLPDGRTNTLIHIPRWDFKWQGDYRLTTPLFLPKGTALEMRYLFDNSTNNPSNPNVPPKRVRYGIQTTDEMAELWLQMLPADAGTLGRLQSAYADKALPEIISYQEYRIRVNPEDAHAHSRLGLAKAHSGDVPGGMTHLRTAIRLDPGDFFTHFNLGVLLKMQGDRKAAEQEFAEAVRLNPSDNRSQGSLGISLVERGRLTEGELHLREALRLDPLDDVAREILGQIERFRATSQVRPRATPTQ